MPGNYYELRIKINPELEDVISEFCFEELPCEGVVLAEETYKDLEMVSTTEGTLRVFLTEKPDKNISDILLEQRKLLKSRGFSDAELGSWDFTFEEKVNQDWSKKWKEKWDITRVSEKLVVVPDWLEYIPKKDEAVIRLEPGCAFGTGTHQTTQLCMKAIEKYMPRNSEVADIGTGSGILAVCAMKFGAKSAYGCDIDETVIDVPNENRLKVCSVRRNSAAATVTVTLNDMQGESKGLSFTIHFNVVQNASSGYLLVSGYDKFVNNGDTIDINLSDLEYEEGHYVLSWRLYVFSESGRYTETTSSCTTNNSRYVEIDNDASTLFITTDGNLSLRVNIWTPLIDGDGNAFAVIFNINLK